MTDTLDVGAQVALAALLDTDCLGPGGPGAPTLAPGLAATDDPGPDGAAELLAAHPTVGRLVRAALVSPCPTVRATVAGRPDLDASLYPVLASDAEPGVRARVAANHAVPFAVLAHLADDADPRVRAAARGERRRRAAPTAHAS